MAESTAFPWLKHLPEDAQREFFEELSEAFGEAQTRTMPGVLVSPQTYVEVLDPLLSAWKATAEVHADPELYKALTQPSGFDEDDFEEVRRPGLCPSNVPHETEEDSARWCVMNEAHAGDHRDRDGFVWNDKDAQERSPGRKPLSCGWCFEENGEEVHPHPECPVDRPDGFDAVLPRITPEDAALALEKLYGGDWSKHIVARQSGPDYVIPTQRQSPEGEADCG